MIVNSLKVPHKQDIHSIGLQGIGLKYYHYVGIHKSSCLFHGWKGLFGDAEE